MIGSRAASGSDAIRFRNVVMACSASSRSASMFTSRRLAPPRTCSSATATAPWKSSASISFLNRAEPVTLVRSPTTTKPVSGRITNGSRPENRGRRTGSATTRGGSPCTARAISRVCSGVVPQQPPTMLTSPSSAKARRNRLVSPGCSSWSPSSFGSPAFGWQEVYTGAICARLSMNGRISVAPSEQLTPTTNGSACSTESQNASTVWPERFRPERSIAVKQIQSGSSGRDLAGGDERRFRVQGVEDRLDHEQVDTSLPQSGDLLGIRVPHLLEAHRPVRGVVYPRRQRERDVERAERARDEARLLRRLRRPLVGGPPRETGAREAHLGGRVLERIVGLTDPVAVNVFVVAMSAPAAKYSSWMDETRPGWVRLRRSGSPLTSRA